MFKRLAIALTIILMLNSTVYAQSGLEKADNQPTDQAKAVVVCEKNTGRILYSYNGLEKMPMASTTKIMTALIALEQENLEEYFTVDSEAIHVEGSSMGLVDGDQVNLLSLVYGMLLPSGNDAANATAVHIGGSIEGFIEIMNAKANQLDLKNTNFETPSGLDAPNHYTTAVDLASLTVEALKNPIFADICSQYRAKVEFGNPPYERWLKNHNKLLERDERCVGVKTGLTDEAGNCLVSAARNSEGEEIIVVTLNSPSYTEYHIGLYDEYFEKMTLVDKTDVLDEIELPVTGGKSETIQIQSSIPLQIPLLVGEEDRLNHKILLDQFEYAPVEKGEYLGKVIFYIDETPILTSDLIAKEDIEEKNSNNGNSFIDKVKDFILKLIR